MTLLGTQVEYDVDGSYDRLSLSDYRDAAEWGSLLVSVHNESCGKDGETVRLNTESARRLHAWLGLFLEEPKVKVKPGHRFLDLVKAWQIVLGAMIGSAMGVFLGWMVTR